MGLILLYNATTSSLEEELEPNHRRRRWEREETTDCRRQHCPSAHVAGVLRGMRKRRAKHIASQQVRYVRDGTAMLRRPRYLFRYGVVLPKLEEPYARQGSFCLCLLLDDVLTAASGDPGALGHVEDTLS